MIIDLFTEFSKSPGRVTALYSRKGVDRDGEWEYFEWGIWEELSTDGKEGRQNTPQKGRKE